MLQRLTTKLGQLTDRVQILETKVDESIKAVDARFDDIDVALAEQRAYTEFSHAQLEAKMDAGFSRVDAGFTRLERKVDAGLTRLECKVDAGFTHMERQMDQLINRRPRRRRS